MFDRLSEKQRNIVDCADNRIVVKACPGSGKTFSVTARLAKLIKNNSLDRHQGIATLSFTNTACEEIRNSIKKNFGVDDVSYPHYIGTLDNFINNYIFLPYGHLIMKCTSRPEIVGTEFNKWYNYDHTKRTYDRSKIADPNYFFDKLSFGVEGKPIPLCPLHEFPFAWKDRITKKGAYRKELKEMVDAKRLHFSEGKANQSDANFIALKLLQQYPNVTKNIAERFPYIIIDEAQDTTAIQMAIVDILNAAHTESLMLIGDPNQAIFEWNTADPSLFMNKYKAQEWTSLELNENRRSSDNICNIINKFFNGNIESVAEDKLFEETSKLMTYKSGISEDVRSIERAFVQKCSDLGVVIDDIAVVYRGNSFAEKHFNITKDYAANNNLVWLHGHSYVRDIVQGKYFIDNGYYKKGTQLVTKGLFKKKLNINYISSIQIKNEINIIGFRKFREKLSAFIDKLPHTDMELVQWISSATANGVKLPVNDAHANIYISQLFYIDNTANQQDDQHIRTIHSVKGMSLDAILVFLTKKGGSTNYSTILSKSYDQLTPDQQEQLRVVYVACSRPKKILWIAVPEDDINIWNDKLQINT